MAPAQQHIIYNACTSHVYVLPEARQTDCSGMVR
jgi:hypothetical protein